MDDDSDMDSEEDAYDLREVSSDVEMHPDDLDLESDARYIGHCPLAVIYVLTVQ